FFGAVVATGLAMTYGPDASGSWLLPLVEAVLAGSIAYAGLENIVSRDRTRRWQTALAVGVATGGFFSVTLRPIVPFAGGPRWMSLVAVGAGALAAGVCALAALTLPLAVLYRLLRRERLRIVMLSALLANFAWTVFIARAGQLPGVVWPTWTPRNMVNATNW